MLTRESITMKNYVISFYWLLNRHGFVMLLFNFIDFSKLYVCQHVLNGYSNVSDINLFSTIARFSKSSQKLKIKKWFFKNLFV